ncbi:MAG: hypothetical protein ABIM99_06365 [Candidatus Dojkabacteria bacterium]
MLDSTDNLQLVMGISSKIQEIRSIINEGIVDLDVVINTPGSENEDILESLRKQKILGELLQRLSKYSTAISNDKYDLNGLNQLSNALTKLGSSLEEGTFFTLLNNASVDN